MLTRSSPSVEQMLRRLESVQPLVQEHRQSFDRDRRLPDIVFKALAEVGLFRLWLPQGLGGPEFSPFEFMEIVEAASAIDGSVGWLVGNGGGMSRVGGHLREDVASEWFSHPLAFVVSATGAMGTATPEDGGHRVTGRWPFGSGSHHGTKFMGLANVKAANGEEGPQTCFYFDRSDVLIEDTWHVSGLRGTGSCHFSVEDVFVATSHSYPMLHLPQTQPGVLYRVPSLSIFPWTVSCVPLGIARGAIDSFIKIAASKSKAGAALRDRETAQMAVGRAEALLRGARAYLTDGMSELLDCLDAEDEQLIQARINLRLACSHAAECALDIAVLLTAEAGATSIFEAEPLERANRDIQAAVRHIAMNASNYLIGGKYALGLDPGSRF